MNRTSRTDFNESWLVESPQNSGTVITSLYFDNLLEEINSLIDSGAISINLGNNYFCIRLSEAEYYWYEINKKIIMAANVDILPQNLKIASSGKDAAYINTSPYMMDLYARIVKDNNKALCLTSDTQLSTNGYKVWQNLVKQGYTVYAYDKNEPENLITIKNEKELEQFYSTNPKSKNYQYVLAESINAKGMMIHNFGTRKLRKLAGLSLED